MSDLNSDSDLSRSGVLHGASRAVALFGGSLMLVAGVLIIASIVMRWVFATSIPGDIELIQGATAIAAFAFLPFGQLRRSTIVVDTFTQRLPERALNAIDAFWDIVYSIAALILSWRLLIAAYDAIRTHTVSSVIGLPIGWFMMVGVAMLFLLSLIAIVTASQLCRGRN
jgi:TRAP-type C4-dicarboxylate transport system permease small subunit